MAVVQSAGAGGGGGQAASVAGLSIDLAAELERLRQDVYALTEVVEQLRTRYNAHAHPENTAPSYTSNATTGAPPSGSQVPLSIITG